MLAGYVANQSNSLVSMWLSLVVELTILAMFAIIQGFSNSLLGGPAFTLYID